MGVISGQDPELIDWLQKIGVPEPDRTGDIRIDIPVAGPVSVTVRRFVDETLMRSDIPKALLKAERGDGKVPLTVAAAALIEGCSFELKTHLRSCVGCRRMVEHLAAGVKPA